MLFTRCPDCDTTFRVTDEALKKANGQVRCGRCASVFNAYSELRQPPAETASIETDRGPSHERRATRTEVPQPKATEPTVAAVTRGATPGGFPSNGRAANQPAVAPQSTPERPSSPVAGSIQEPAADRADPRPTAPTRIEPIRSTSNAGGRLGRLVADVVAQVERGGADPNTPDSDDLDKGSDLATGAASITPAQIEAVLETQPPIVTGGESGWPLEAPERRSSRGWSIAALCALLALGLQAVNHFRSDLAGNAWIGPTIRAAYALVGIAVTPRWDVRQYEILDWVATAEPNARGQGSLKITARLQNHGPRAQPYPLVQLRLKDRFEATVGSRIFKPTEYLDNAGTAETLMAPGATARAQLEVVDPGPDAYGFDLDVCIEIETDVLTCRNDKVFR